MQRRSKAPCRAHETFRQRIGSDADKHALAGGPRVANRMIVAVFAHGRIDALGCRAQRELAQCDQIALAEKRLERVPALFRRIDLALAHALQQVVGRQVDEFDFVGGVEYAVGYRFAHGDAGDLRDDIVEALDVLHIDRRIDVDAGLEQLDDVHPAFRMACAGMVAVREFIDEDDLRMALERGVEIEFDQCQAAMLELLRRQDFHALRAALRFPDGHAVRRSRR